MPPGESVFIGIEIIPIGAQSRLCLSLPPFSFLGKNAIKLVPS